jgi:glycine cleavage system H protein
VEFLGCSVPDELRVDVENGVWLRPEPDGRATLGLLAPFVAFAGRISGITFRPLTGAIAAGRSVAMIESQRLTAPVRTPVAGTMVEVHDALSGAPRLVHDAPYDAGWFVRLLPEPGALERLPTAAQARAAIEAQIRERRVRCYAALPDLEVYEIGAECRAILVRLDEELARRAVGEVVLLVVDDPTAPIEMVRWSDRTGYPILEQRRADDLWHFLVRKTAAPIPRRRTPES